MKANPKRCYLPLVAVIFAINLNAQTTEDAQYLAVVQQRAFKIIAPMGIKDSAKFYRVRDQIAQEYIAIKAIDEGKATAIAAVRAKNQDKAATDAAIEKINKNTEARRTDLNKQFVQSLAKQLSDQQIEQVKDGLTYNVLPLTYKAHLDMIPSLKEEEKKYIYNALLEAREHAMAAGSSDAKHGWFGEYKGRINNYLTARGYDLKKERIAWNERVQSKKL